jgi:RNA polymerase sigma-70 factor (ECF subfamily)
MDSGEREQLERDIRHSFEQGDLQGAASAAIRGYGPEIFGLLAALHRREADASEVFSRFAENLWRGLPSFGWHCSFRTWAYTVARNASTSYRRQARRRAEVHVPLPEGSELSAIQQDVRSETLSYLRTQRKTRVLALREALSPEDQTLLVLRVDKRLPWNDLARVMHGEEGELADEVVKKEAARLRKRFQLIKEKLYELGRREGLVGTRGDDE